MCLSPRLERFGYTYGQPIDHIVEHGELLLQVVLGAKKGKNVATVRQPVGVDRFARHFKGCQDFF